MFLCEKKVEKHLLQKRFSFFFKKKNFSSPQVTDVVTETVTPTTLQYALIQNE
jgi:hypothetical protein